MRSLRRECGCYVESAVVTSRVRLLRRECGCYESAVVTRVRSLRKCGRYESAGVTKVRALRKCCRLAQSVAKTEHMFIGSDDNLNRIINASLIHIDGLAIN